VYKTARAEERWMEIVMKERHVVEGRSRCVE
jgi:hypothetical protein